jgi:1,4-alpha-glucan branching enzyme
VYEPQTDGKVVNYLVLASGARTIPDGLELFEWFNANANDVVLAGDFNNWQQGNARLAKDADGVWRCRLHANRPITYKFVVDDLWLARARSARGIEWRPDNFGEHHSSAL